MPTEVFIPKMTDHMETALLNRWLVQPGERVERGQPILEVETDKASAEVEAPASGILAGIRAEQGAEVPVGEVIAFILQPGEEIPELAAAAAAAAIDQVAPASAEDRSPEVRASASPDEGDAVRATPAARRVARELGIDLRQLRGSGPQGRIREEDVRAAFQAGATQPAAASFPRTDSSEWMDLTRTQLITGRRMVESIQTAPHFALTAAVDVTETLRRQAELSGQIQAATGSKLTLTAVLVRVCAAALRRYPRANVSFHEGRLRRHDHVNIGVAIGTDDGLVAPVIKDADRKKLAEIVTQLEDYRRRTQEKRLTPDELNGGTFTLSNLGMYGIDQFTAIINPPESAILAVGRAKKVPVVIADETLALRSLITLTLSIDHRSLDGVQGARLMAEIGRLLEQPASME